MHMWLHSSTTNALKSAPEFEPLVHMDKHVCCRWEAVCCVCGEKCDTVRKRFNFYIYIVEFCELQCLDRLLPIRYWIERNGISMSTVRCGWLRNGSYTRSRYASLVCVLEYNIGLAVKENVIIKPPYVLPRRH